jgi:DNA repair photolyase
MFADPARNPLGCKLFLLTRSQNVRFLAGLPTQNTIVSFSLNPQDIADLWEGKWPDTLERIPPPINNRLDASLRAQQMGFEVRWRIDPILTPVGWQAQYLKFFKEAAGSRPTRITLGTFRETRASLDYWRRHWNLPAMEWRPETFQRDGTHRHVPAAYRIQTYSTIVAMCAEFFPDSSVALCKETNDVRSMSGLTSASCNCLP